MERGGLVTLACEDGKAKTQISVGIKPLYNQKKAYSWFLRANIEDSDQTGQVVSLV